MPTDELVATAEQVVYDLTPLFTTIAAASASIVAILGGFIASKLISISAEREGVISKLAEVEERQKHRQSELSEIQNSRMEDEAISFVSSNIEPLLGGKPLDVAYREDIQQEISKSNLEPYWCKALDLSDELSNLIQEEGAHLSLNEDRIPVKIARKYTNDTFAYAVCKKIMKYLTRQIKKNNALYAALNPDFDFGDITRASSIWEEGRMNELKSEVAWLNYQKQQLTDEKTHLKKPKGMHAGLILFAIFSVFCIIIPLILTPMVVTDYCLFLKYKITVIAIFAIGLAAVFIYLAYLLKWKDDETQ